MAAAPAATPSLTPAEVMRCAVWYFHNHCAREQFYAATGAKLDGFDRLYVLEQVAKYRAGMIVWFNGLDPNHQEWWTAAAIDRYRDDVLRDSAARRAVR